MKTFTIASERSHARGRSESGWIEGILFDQSYDGGFIGKFFNPHKTSLSLTLGADGHHIVGRQTFQKNRKGSRS